MNGRSIQDIIPPARSRPIRQPLQPMQEQQTPPRPPLPPQPQRLDGGRSKLFILLAVIIGALVVVGASIGLMSTIFHTATVTATIAEWEVDSTGTYGAGGDASLQYQLMSFEDRASKTVPATGTVAAEDRATGTIIVSNAYSTKSQRLITNTRFESPDGNIYRIHSPITVPGYTTKDGQKVPGTIEAVVYADQPGEKYNTGLTTFTIPGLKGSPQFDSMTARSKTPMEGGFVGTRAVVEKAVRDEALVELRATLERGLRERLQGEIPVGTTFFPDSLQIAYREEPDAAEGESAVLTVVGTAFAPVFETGVIARELAARTSVIFEWPLMLANPSEVTYTPVSGDPRVGGDISFALSGMAHLVASFSPEKLAMDLAGKEAEDLLSIREQYPALVVDPTVEVYPFWMSRAPQDPGKITVTTVGALDQNP